MTPEEIAKSMGITYTPGMSYSDFQKQVRQKEAIAAMSGGPPPIANNPIQETDTNAPLPAPPIDFKKLAVANMAPVVEKKVKLEGAPIIAPPAGGPPPVAAPAPDAGLGLDLSKLRAIPGQIVPGHTQQAASMQQIGAIEGAMKKEETAAQHLSDAQQNVNEVTSQEQTGLAGTREALRMQAEQQEQKRQQVLGQHIDQQNALMDDIRSSKVDPNRWAGDGVLGAFRQVGALIAMTMGGYAAGLRGGPNTAAEIIQRRIDRDIDLQKDEIEKKKGLLGDSRALFAQKMQQFGDQRAAEAAAKSDAYAAAEALAQAHVADAKTDEQRATGEMIVAKLQQARGEKDRELNPWVPPKSVGGATIEKQLELLGKVQGLEKGQAELGKTRAETQKLQAQATSGGGPKKGLPSGVITQLSSVDSAIQALDDEIALTKDTSISLADKRARSKKNLDILSLEIPHAFTGGVPTPEQQHETKANLPSQQGSLSFQNISPIGAPDRMRQLESQKQQLMHKRRALEVTANEQRNIGSSDKEEEE